MSIVEDPPRWRVWIRKHRWLARCAAVVVVAGLAVSVTFVVRTLTGPALPCGDGMYQDPSGSACIGIDLDSGPIAPGEPGNMAALESIIKGNNDVVSHAPPATGYVSIALLLNLSPQSGMDTISYSDIGYQIEGVITAVWQANHTKAYGTEPKIKLFLANLGGNRDNSAPNELDNQWSDAVDRIRSAQQANHIVSVIDLGQSVDATRRAAIALTDGGNGNGGIPVIGGTITGDTMNYLDDGTRDADFYRVAPTNSQSVGVAAQYVATMKLTPAQVAVVQDDVKGDDYVKTLATAADRLIPAPPANQYHFKSNPDLPAGLQRDEDLGGQFRYVDGNMCQPAPPRAIYFAGRGADLGAFVQTLEQTGTKCGGAPITIITGDDAGEALPDDRIASAREQGVTVLFTSLASPDEWGPCQADPTGSLRDFTEFEAAFTGQTRCGIDPGASDGVAPLSFAVHDLDSGQAMITHDDAGVAVTVARGDDVDATDMSGGGPAVQDPGSQIAVLQNLSCRHPFPGASGHIYYGTPETGAPLNKVEPIVEITGVNQTETLPASEPTAPDTC